MIHLKQRNNVNASSVPNDNEGDDDKSVNEDTAFFKTAEQIKVFIMRSQKTYATILFILVGISIGLAIAGIQVTYKAKIFEKIKEDAENQTLYSNDTKYEKIIAQNKDNISLYGNVKLGLESALTVVSLATCVSLYYYYRTVFMLKKVRHEYPKTILFINARPLFPKFLVELILCLLHLPPYLSTNLNPKFQLLVFIRIYLIGRYLQQKHSLMHSQSTRCLARLGNTKLTSLFLVKASFRKYPFQMMVFGYTSFLLISTYVVWLLEETYSYFDTMWMLIIAMTTVGFGDLTPKSTLGRLAVTATSLVGILFIAIFCFLASQALTLQRKEKRVLAYYEKKENLLSKKKAALNAIGMWYKYYSYKSKMFPSHKHVHWDAESGIRNGRKESEFSIKSLKLSRLKTKMYKGITYWRALRNNPEGVAYNQDFVLEDMKIMVHNMSNNIDELIERPIENLFDKDIYPSSDSDDQTSDEEDLTEQNNSRASLDKQHQYHQHQVVQTHSNGHIHKQQLRHLHQYHDHNQQNHLQQHQTSSQAPQEIIPTVKIIPPNELHNRKGKKSNHQNHIGQTPVQRDTKHPYNDSGQQSDRSCDSKFTNPNSIKILEELLTDVPHGVYDCSQRDKNIMIAFNLMKIQQNLLNNAIETIYHKTKYDVNDIQRRVSSFMRPTSNNCKNVYETGL